MENYTHDASFVAGYRISTAETSVYELLDLLKDPKTHIADAYEIIDTLGALVGEISAQVNGYFDDNEIDHQFNEFIR